MPQAHSAIKGKGGDNLKKLITIFAALILLALSSCVPEIPDPPYGVWQSDDPRITLFFTPEYQVIEGREFYFGLYSIDNVDKKVFAQFGPGGGGFGINDLSEPRNSGGCVLFSRTLIGGNYRLIENMMIYTLSPHSQERLGIETITFHLIDDYEPICPEWIANFVPRPE